MAITSYITLLQRHRKILWYIRPIRYLRQRLPFMSPICLEIRFLVFECVLERFAQVINIMVILLEQFKPLRGGFTHLVHAIELDAMAR